MAMALEMDGIIECGVIDLVMYVGVSAIIEGGVVLWWATIFKKKSVVFTNKLYGLYSLRVL